MAADNNLYPYAKKNIAQMRPVRLQGKANVIAQLDKLDYTNKDIGLSTPAYSNTLPTRAYRNTLLTLAFGNAIPTLAYREHTSNATHV
jgi:hypothetical protein